MKRTNFKKWANGKLASNLPIASVIIFDDVSYHSIQLDNVPLMYTVKKDLIKWLQRNGTACDLSMRKEELFVLVKINKPKEKDSESTQQ
jgi:hypothetical protein